MVHRHLQRRIELIGMDTKRVDHPAWVRWTLLPIWVSSLEISAIDKLAWVLGGEDRQSILR